MYALMSDFKMLCCHVSLVPRLEPETTGHFNKAKLQQSLLMDVDLPLGTEQALMLHSVYIIPCICCHECLVLSLRGGHGVGLTLHQIRELDGSHVGHVLAMAPSTFKTLASQCWSDVLHCTS